MNAKEYLQQIKRLDTLINRKTDLLYDLKSQVLSITASAEGERVKHSSNVHRMEDTIVKIIDLQNEINTIIDQLVDVKREILTVIDSLDDADLIDLLYRRYVYYEKWEDIALKMNYNVRWIYRLHKKALQKISEKLKTGR